MVYWFSLIPINGPFRNYGSVLSAEVMSAYTLSKHDNSPFSIGQNNRGAKLVWAESKAEAVVSKRANVNKTRLEGKIVWFIFCTMNEASLTATRYMGYDRYLPGHNTLVLQSFSSTFWPLQHVLFPGDMQIHSRCLCIVPTPQETEHGVHSPHSPKTPPTAELKWVGCHSLHTNACLSS